MRRPDRFTGVAARAHLPRPTVRLRLTVLYSSLFLVCAVGLLTVVYVLVRSTTESVMVTTHGSSTAGAWYGVGVALDGPPPKNAGPVTIGGPTGLAPTQMRAEAIQLQGEEANYHAAELDALLFWSGVALVVMATVSIPLSWVVAGRVLRPLRTITMATRQLSATNLHQRLALTGPDDELKELGDTFDELLARLERSFEAQRRFVANASHELRTPLARQRAVAQVALADPQATAESLRLAHERVLASGAEQEQIIDALLTLAQGEAGLKRREAADLAAITAGVLQGAGVEIERRSLLADERLEPAVLTGDPRLVERLVANLVENAVRHNVPGGQLEVTTGISAGRAVLSVSNTGPMIPPSEIGRLFQPFQRLAGDRASRGEGAGLGLSIVQAIAAAHGADVTARARPGGGLDVEVLFPLTTGDPRPLP